MRHDALRTVFLSTPDGVRQRPLADLSFEVATADLTEAADPEQAALALAEANAARSFDLATGPLLAATLLTLAPDRHVLLFQPPQYAQVIADEKDAVEAPRFDIGFQVFVNRGI